MAENFGGGGDDADVVVDDGHQGPCCRDTPACWTCSGPRKSTCSSLPGYRLFHTTGRRPAHWFGYGLTYNPTGWRPPELVATDESVDVRVEVRTKGTTQTSDVVQVYLDVAHGSHEAALPTLAGSYRVSLDPDESRVTVVLAADLVEKALDPPVAAPSV